MIIFLILNMISSIEDFWWMGKDEILEMTDLTIKSPL